MKIYKYFKKIHKLLSKNIYLLQEHYVVRCFGQVLSNSNHALDPVFANWFVKAPEEFMKVSQQASQIIIQLTYIEEKTLEREIYNKFY